MMNDKAGFHWAEGVILRIADRGGLRGVRRWLVLPQPGTQEHDNISKEMDRGNMQQSQARFRRWFFPLEQYGAFPPASVLGTIHSC